MNELNGLKVRIFDLTETMNGMQLALNRIAEAAGFNDGSVDDLITHVGKLKEHYNNGINSKGAATETGDGGSGQRSDGGRARRASQKD